MKIKKKDKDEFSIDITPLVDVLFTLLIFFSLTTTFSRSKGMIKVELPKASSAQTSSVPPQLIVTVDYRGEFYIKKRHISPEELKKILSSIDKDKRFEYLILVKADKMAPHGRVITILDIARSLGYERVDLEVKKR